MEYRLSTRDFVALMVTLAIVLFAIIPPNVAAGKIVPFIILAALLMFVGYECLKKMMGIVNQDNILILATGWFIWVGAFIFFTTACYFTWWSHLAGYRSEPHSVTMIYLLISYAVIRFPGARKADKFNQYIWLSVPGIFLPLLYLYLTW